MTASTTRNEGAHIPGRDILVLYRTLEYPMRATISDHLFSFRRYANARCLYVNVASQSIPRSLATHPFDLIIFHTTLLSSRVRHERFLRLIAQLEFLAEGNAVRIALPQDEHIHTTILSEFVNRLAVDHVFSVAPEETWPMIYRDVDTSKVALHRVLTGYLEPRTLERIDRLAAASTEERPTDVGYRAHGVRYNLGRHGHLKIKIACAFTDAAHGLDLHNDISTKYEDTFLGDSWYRFLLRCRYVLGIEGGASLHDPEGRIGQCIQTYLAENPQSSFEEVEEACFLGLDGAFPLYALSPRHLEAAATRTGQLLVEGDYNGILEPGTHFVSIKKDLSNLDEAIAATADEPMRRRMVSCAYDDVARSGRYTYDRFVDFVVRTALPTRQTTMKRRSLVEDRRRGWFLHVRVRLAGWFGWLVPLGIGFGARTLHVLARRGPTPLGRSLRKIEKRVRGK